MKKNKINEKILKKHGKNLKKFKKFWTKEILVKVKLKTNFNKN